MKEIDWKRHIEKGVFHVYNFVGKEGVLMIEAFVLWFNTNSWSKKICVWTVVFWGWHVSEYIALLEMYIEFKLRTRNAL